MEQLSGRTAVITGGASGMGRAFASRFADAGMNLVLGDIEEPALDTAVAELRAQGTTVLGRCTDVGSADSVEELAAAARAEFGTVEVVCLNAGVGGGNGPMDQLTLADWRWVLDVNVYGIVHGLLAFLPGLVEQDEGHVVITASIAGLTSYGSMGPYNTSKHAAVAIAESLFADLAAKGSDVGVTCLCPGLVQTNIFTSDRNRPEDLRNPLIPEAPSDDDQGRIEALIEIVTTHAKAPDHVAELVHDAVLAKQFWVFTDEDFTPAIHRRLDSIRDRTDPTGTASLLDLYL